MGKVLLDESLDELRRSRAGRGGGHNPAGHCVGDGGLVIDLSLMRRVEVSGEARIVHADGGAT